MTNSLSENMSTHLHGGHTPSDNNNIVGSDGGPMALFGPGTTRTYTYPNNQIASTLWYHDHAMDLTAAHVYEGLAAPYIVTDSVDQGLGLPGGSYDIPLVIQDKTFNADGSLCYQVDSSTIRQGFQGDTLLVNGAVQPYFKVAQRKYRLRFLNGSNSSRYELALSTGDSLVQIASDGGLLQAPVSRTSALIAPAEREEFVIDFSKYPIGTQIVLNNNQSWGTRTTQLMRFDVSSTATDTSNLPATLTTIKKIDPNTATVRRTWTLDSNNGTWSLNGLPFDPNRIDAQVKLGSTEVWTFQNRSGEYHPIHVHDMEFQVVSEDGGAVPACDAGWKDVFLVKPWSSVQVVTTFVDNLGHLRDPLSQSGARGPLDDGPVPGRALAALFAALFPPFPTCTLWSKITGEGARGRCHWHFVAVRAQVRRLPRPALASGLGPCSATQSQPARRRAVVPRAPASGEDLGPKEEAAALDVLVRKRGWSPRRVHEAIKRGPMYVSRRLRVSSPSSFTA